MALAAVSKELTEPNFGTLEEDLRAQANDLSAALHAERSQIIEACRLDLNFLAPMAMPDTFEEDFPPVHLLIWQMLTAELVKEERGFPKIALGIPRGHAKTTLVKLAVLYAILFTKRKWAME